MTKISFKKKDSYSDDFQDIHEKWNILVVDDDSDVVRITGMVLSSFEFEGRKIDLFTASNAEEAKRVLNGAIEFAVIILDVVMETDDAGLRLVEYIRNILKNDLVQIILRTGFPGDVPEDEVIIKYKINDYRSKAELRSSQLRSSVTSAIRAYELALKYYRLSKNLNDELCVEKEELCSLELLNKELEKRVKIRTQALAKSNSELKRVLLETKNLAIEAKKSNLIKTRFLTNISHEIRTPLNGITGIISLLKRSELNEESKNLVDILSDSTDALSVLLNDVLDFAKLEDGRILLEEDEFDIRDFVTRCIKNIKFEADRKKLTINLNISNAIPKIVKGDSSRLMQIFMNILGNAVKFTNSGKIDIDIDIRKKEDDFLIVEAQVEDTGIGIEKNKLEKLFSPFFQVDSSAKRKYGGAGLGLSIVKKIVERMSGEIYVESIDGIGSKFIWTMKFGRVPVYNEDKADPVNRDYENFFQGKKVLVVEDHPVNQIVAKKILEKMGVDPDLASNGKIALEKLSEKEYHLVLMDIQMPEMDGLEATIEFRKKTGNPNYGIPILALTANSLETDKEDYIGSGMNDMITKPINQSKLGRVIEKYLVKK